LPVAYLCLGYPRAFLGEPELQRRGWATQLPLSQMIFEERWATHRSRRWKGRPRLQPPELHVAGLAAGGHHGRRPTTSRWAMVANGYSVARPTRFLSSGATVGL
jgi:hypothetical protein